MVSDFLATREQKGNVSVLQWLCLKRLAYTKQQGYRGRVIVRALNGWL